MDELHSTDWQPIKTAPSDGTVVRLRRSSGAKYSKLKVAI